MARFTAIREPSIGKFRYPVDVPNGFPVVSLGEKPIYMNDSDRNWVLSQLLARSVDKEPVLLEFIVREVP